MKHPKLLIIEDELSNQQVLKRLLQEQYKLEICDSAEQGWKRLDLRADIDLVLLDLNLPGMSGLVLLQQIRAQSRFDTLPVLILTGMTDEEDEARGLSMGASDYIYKPFRPQAVKLRISNQLKLAAQSRELQEITVRDHLTGLYNRRGFDAIYAEELARANRSGVPLSLALIDVDNFKQYNDCYGHPEGDKALQFIARHLNAVTRRATDLAARIGGEEFILLWTETSRKGAQHQADKLRQSIEQESLAHAEVDLCRQVTISIGGVTLEAGDYDAERAMQRVDDALYEAKNQGRNRVIWQADSIRNR